MQQRLYRSEADRMLGGVAGGIAERFGWDPTLVRLAWVLVTLLASGIPLPVYLALWLITPTYSRVHGSPQDKGSATGQTRPPNWRAIVGAVVLAVGALALLGATGRLVGAGVDGNRAPLGVAGREPDHRWDVVALGLLDRAIGALAGCPHRGGRRGAAAASAAGARRLRHG